MKRTRRPKKSNRIFSTLVAMLLALSMMSSTIFTAVAAEIAGGADAGEPVSYTAEEAAAVSGEAYGDESDGGQELSAEGSGSNDADAGLSDGAQADPEGFDETAGDGSDAYGADGETGVELFGEEGSDEESGLLEEAADGDETGDDGLQEYAETIDGEAEEEDADAEVSDYTFVAEYLGDAWQVDSEEEFSAEDFVVYVYDADGELIDTLEAESVTSDYEVDEDGYILALVMCIFEGEAIEVEAKILAIDTLAAGETGAFAVYSADDSSLTFYYGEEPEEGTEYNGKTATTVYTGFDTEIYSGYSSVPWYSDRANITNVAFDESFADVQPLATAYWFYNFTNCTGIDMTYLDTSAVTNMAYMFYYCSGLTSLDVSGFDTSYVMDMQSMFRYCSSLKSVDVSGFNTANVTDMSSMFRSCSALTTIYSNDDNFVTTAVTSGGSMFTSCSKIVGGNGTAYSSGNVTYTMAHVDAEEDPGYFTDESVQYAPVAFAVYSADDSSLTFYFDNPVPDAGDQYNEKTVTAVYTEFVDKTYSSTSLAPWNSNRSNFTSVVIDDSFSGVQPTSMAYWFYYFTNCVEFIGLENIDTSCVTTMEDLFRNCASVTSLDISFWDTSSVTNMAQMFYECKSLTFLDVRGIVTSSATALNGMLRDMYAITELDLSGWDTSSVTKINALFRLDDKLETVYVDEDWDLGSLGSSNDSKNLFYSCESIVGGNGTVWDSSKVDYDMAHIDTPDNPGYFTNAKVLDTVEISGTKIWDDADDQDGIRPESITVKLFANEEPATDENGDPISMTVTAEDDWSFTFSDEPKYDENFDEITYTITEDAVTGYESEITGDMEDGFVITNTHAPEQTEVSGTITWADGNDQDGKRPAYVAVQLIAQDSEGGVLGTWEFELHAPADPSYDDDGNEVWTWTMDGLNQYYGGGQAVNYTVIYTGVDLSVYEQTTDDLDTTYSYTPETTTISGSKTWVDGDNVENTRPESITVRLHANGNEKVYEQTVTAEDGWAWTFEDMPVYSNGQHVDYTITEDSVENYYPSYDGWDITNTLDRGKTSITVMKDWEDANDQDGKRAGSVTVSLWANGVETGETLTLSEENNWEENFHSLAIDDENGIRITYTITEKAFGDEYETEITGDVTEGFVITNSYTPEEIDITGSKEWNDADDQDGMRPSSIYVHLMANGTAVDEAEVTEDANGDWTFTFTGMPKCAGGSEIEYAVEEVLGETAAEAYTASYSGDVEKGFTITNTHTPELLNGDGTLAVTKVWNDDDDRDGIRPDDVTVHLLADGETIDTAVLGRSAGDVWTVTFTNLSKYADGKEIAYTITEDSVDRYTAAVTGSTAEGFILTNTHNPETIRVNVDKIWDDEEDQDGKRPVSITIRLLADGDPALDQNGDAITAVMDEEDGWDWIFWNLYKYRDGGTEIVYTIEEDTTDFADIYTTSIEGDMADGFTITNSYTPELYNGDGTFKVVVVWDDEANNDGIRPTEVNVKLTKNNTTVDGAEMTLTADEVDADGNWTGTFTGLPKYENGSEIIYSVKEDVKSGYTYRIELLTDESGNTYVQLTNVHVSVKEDIEVTKIWDDNYNQDGIRPDSITVYLLVNGSLYKEKILTEATDGVSVSEDGNVWKYTMSDIPVDKNGEAIAYTMLEVDVENYGTPEIVTIRGDEITDNGVTYQPYAFEVTNSHTPEQITVSGTKVWEDANDQDGKRPHYVELDLLADGVVVERIDVSPEDAEENDPDVWTWTFSAHDKYKDGVEIEYTVEEVEAAGYTTEITGSAADGFTITNSYTPETTTISGSKTWVDDDNAANTRPDSITVRLHANGNENVYEQTVTAGDGWAWEFADVPVYANGKYIEYTLTEDAVDDYDTTYTFGDDGTLNVTNTLAPGQTSLTVEKDWEDNENQDGLRPAEVTIELMRDETATGDTLTLSDADHWTDTFHNLEEYDNGIRIEYTVQEVSVDGYDSDIAGDVTTGYTITNTHEPATINLSGSKAWEDNDDQDGIRPDHVTIHLLADGEAVESHTVTAEDNWEWKFTDLDKYAAGEEIEYTMEEVFVADGYEVEPGTAGNDFTFTNTHEPEVIDITGTKTWEDDNDRDGIRPASVTVSLLAGSLVVASQTVNADNDWTYTFSGYDKYAGGEEIDYSIREEVPAEYQASYNHFDYDVTNTHSPELFNGDGTLGVIMHWDDEEDQDGLRPKRTTITLMVNGVPDETITLVLSDDNMDANGNWIGTFTDLYKYADGAEIEYNVEEGVMNGYTYTAELLYDEDTDQWYIEITNTHAAVTSDITVTKVWDDNDDQDGIRPDSVVVNLFSNGSAVKSVTITPGKEGVEVSDDGNAWSYTFENMPVDQNGEAILYTLDEVDVGSYAHQIATTATEKVIDYEGYEFSYTQYEFTVTNSHTPATAEVSGEKIWEDADDQDGIRPHSITIELLADGVPALDENGHEITQTVTPHTDGSWTWNFTDIPKYRDGGTEIVYSFEEFTVDGYETSYSDDGRTVTNTYEPETTSISGNKVWDDDNDRDGVRPKSIKVNLYANGLIQDTRTVTAADDWAWTFDDLPVYANGKKITYVTTEIAIEDYDTSYSGFTLTNTYEPGKTSVTVIADWEDEEDQDGIRPTEITVPLLADGEPALDEDGNAITLTLTEDENGIWEGSFEHLNEYRDGGTWIEYTIGEVTVDGYDCVVEGDAETGYSLTFTHEPETIGLSVSKTWDDADDQDGLRPDQITIHLLADGEDILTEEVTPAAAGPLRRVAAIMTLGTVVSAEEEWSYTFADLPKYANGQEITYTVTESAVTGYGTSITGDAENGFEIKNTHVPETVTVSGTKVWRDADDQDGKRPETITINLQADGKNTQSLEVTGDGDTWDWSFADLPKYASGEEISYEIAEIAVSGYDTTVAGDAAGGYTIINTHTPETLTVSGSKTWDDEDNQDGLRPGSVTIRLHKNGEVIATRTVTAYDGWSWTFSNEPKYENGLEIAYTITEDALDDYSASVDGYDVTNSYTPGQTSLTVVKDWEDGNDQDGIRPTDLTVRLLADGAETGETLTLSEANGWEGTFTELNEYSEGARIEYTVEEPAVDAYDSAITGDETEGYVITNTHEPETIEIAGSKNWDDAEDQDGRRPESIRVKLLNQNGRTLDTQTVTAEDGWTWNFTVDRYENGGKEIDYSGSTVEEDAVADYTTEISGDAADGFVVTNSHETETIEIAGSKVWDDADDQDGRRPASITVSLLDADGDTVDSTVVTADEDWAWSFAVDKYAGGKEIDYSGYSMKEDAVVGYDASVTGSAADGFEITNTHEPETIEIAGNKAWDDADDQDGKRPESISVSLLDADGDTVDSTVVTADDGWAWSFEVDKYADGGKEIDYSGYRMEEAAVDDYDTTAAGSAADGFVITNTHEPEQINGETHVLAVTLRWNDEDNVDGLRPSYVTLTLMADGDPVLRESGEPVTLILDGSEVDADGNWIGTFDLSGVSLYRYQGGLEIGYTVGETDDGDQDLAADSYSSRTALVYNAETGIWHLEVTNSHTTAKQDITVTKVWNDDNDRDGKRPESISLYLMANGEVPSGGSVKLTEENVTVSDDGNTWTYVFEEMAVDENGTAIEYTLEEGAVSKYVSDVEPERGEETTDSGVTYKPYAFTVTNTHEIETIDLSGTIQWKDDNNKADSRPDSVTIHLYADGVEIATTTATAESGWTWSFTDLPKYADGKEIVYTITEDRVDGYEIEITGDEEHGFVITDTLESVKDDEGGGNGGNDGNGGTGGNDGNGGTGGNDGNGGSGGTGIKGGNGSPTGTIGGNTGDTNVVGILLIIIFIAAAAAIVVLVWRITGRRYRR